jgi:hypothetical protein
MRSPILSIGAALLLGTGAACVNVVHESPRPTKVVVKEPGPPPHAPAHGYRRKHQQDGVDLVFDSGLGVYVVVGTPDCWWLDGGYYRWRDGVWSMGVHVSGPWTAVEVGKVPSGLRGYKGNKHGKGKGKGGPPASRQR